MFVVAQTVIRYLLARGLLEVEDVVAGRVVVQEERRRNNNLRVSVDGRRGLFLKQAASEDPSLRETLDREAWVYAQVPARAPKLDAITPRRLHFDAHRSILVTELLDGLTIGAAGAAVDSVELAVMLGAALARAHEGGASLVQETDERLPRHPPSVLLLTDSECVVSPSVHPGIVEAIHELPELAGALTELRGAWSGDTLIHGDVKWDNVLLVPDAGGEPRIVLVDWELADVGDPAWDVAGMLYGCLLDLISEDGEAAGARRPPTVEARRLAVARALWSTYIACRGLSPRRSAALLVQSTRLAGARLVQSAVEAQALDQPLARSTLVLLQLAANVMRAPRRAHTALLGLESPLSSGVSVAAEVRA
ncbi:phosphotransferase [Enhygromyxa salina]|uniref:Phosphotransferase enzyme family protein n=1 Tax=Enhygromyxa salina TaxID=215803 RepID=A0A2S9YT19_9BACT|nr:phosphotransferase [Enhygromyxa salina]PRQ08182.1 Phosphotransferase enzyme family protein [Enhygromyxa salina]